MSSKRLPPKWVSKQAPDPSPVEGVDNLPLPAGTNRWAVAQAERDSEATPNAMGQDSTVQAQRMRNGDNPTIEDQKTFGTGQDVRAYGSSPDSNPIPAKPGA